MDFNFQTIFTHFSPTYDQMKAALQDFWRKNEENQVEIARLQQKNVDSQGEISRLRQENSDHEKKITFLNHEYDKINQQSSKIAELERENIELRRKNSDFERKKIFYIELERKHTKLKRILIKLRSEKIDLEDEIEEQKPSCLVCMENFDTEERQPYALSCPHMVCAQCLHPDLETNEFIRLSHREASIILDSHPPKRCPICRTQVTTPLKKICLQT